MIFIPFITAVLFGALATAFNLKSPMEGYSIAPMSWKAVNTTDGSDLVLHGTIQELDQQLEVMDDVELLNYTNVISAATADKQTVSLAPRTKDNIVCWVGGSGAVKNGWLQTGIDYLKQHTQRPCMADPGWGTCVRISCSYNVAIWLCNDAAQEVVRPCPEIATYAEDIRAQCTYGVSIQGQEFDTDLFNVIVGRELWC